MNPESQIIVSTKLTLALIATAVMSFSCSKDDGAASDSYTGSENTEIAQQAGDTLASIDEIGGGTSGSYSFNNNLPVNNQFSDQSAKKIASRYFKDQSTLAQAAFNHVLPLAQAATCGTVSFSSCTSQAIEKDFASCSLGTSTATMSGTINVSFAGTGASSCRLTANNDTATRVPNFSITGARGANFSVTGGSQVLTKTGTGTFSFTSSNINRKFVTSAGKTLVNFTTSTVSPVTITGSSRSGRTITGSFKVVNNLNNNECTLTSTGVTWSSGCNCPTSGTTEGTCSQTSSYKIDYTTNCGTVNLTVNGESSQVDLDRCY